MRVQDDDPVMNPTCHEEEVFCQALEIPDASHRESFLRRVCRSDPRLRKSVDAMLADHDQATRLFQKVAADTSLDEDAELSEAAPFDQDLGTTIGPYRLVERLGEGGGGVVYEASQEAPVHRRVALKILKAGLDHRRVIRRFQAERQALELMEHPNIARVLDAGLTPDGRPYFVMELVRGTKITTHCTQHALPLTARLQLMQQICSAVQHAHQKGIIHCDLKPSNILVTLVEGMPVPKVIDFGIAKATASTSAEWTVHGYPVGTPAYMSPEQINGSRDIDTRSDIYSLGRILSELMGGRPPNADEPSMQPTPHVRRQPLDLEAPLAGLPVEENSIAHRHWNDDLKVIVMTAIEKDREHRYSTVRGLSQDIARYLANEPILARAPSRIYRLKKFVRRNRVASSAIAAGVLTLVAGFTTSSLLYLKAETAEREQVQLRAQAEAAELQQSKLRAEAEERAHVTRAAILIMQNKTEASDAEIQQMGGMLTQPSVEATNVFHKLATWNALRGNWKAASQRLLALSRVNRFDDSDMTDNATRDLVPIAPTLVEAGDIHSLRQFENMLVGRLGHTSNPIAAEEVLKICLQYPPANDLLMRLAPVAAVAEKSITNKNSLRITWLEAWRCFAIGLWYYRTGHYAQSRSFLDLAMTAPQNEQVVNACCLAARSMASRKLGQTADADADLAKATAMVDKTFSVPLEMDHQGLWHDWLTARILLREAAAP